MIKMQSVLFGIGGLVIGAAAGVFGSRTYFKKKFEKVADEEIEEMKTYCDNMLRYAAHDAETMNKVSKEFGEWFEKSGLKEKQSSRADGMQDPEERKKVKDKLTKNWKGTTDYASRYKIKNPPEKKFSDDQSELVPGESENFDYQEWKNNAIEMGKTVQIISASEVGDLPSYVDHQVIFYYVLKSLFTDEDMNVIEDPEQLVGEEVTLYDDWLSIDDDTELWVMNYELDTVYEIQKNFFELDRE